MRVLVFGDSIAHGFYDSKGGWVQRLATDMHTKTLAAMNSGGDFYVEVHNLGVSGDTTEGVLDRIETEVEARRLYDGEDIIIIAIGTNDAILRDNIAIQDVYEFQEVFEELLKEAGNLADKILCVGLPAVDESLTDPWKFSATGKQWKNNRIDLFEDTIKQAAERKDLPFVPIYDKYASFMKAGKKLHSDGLHPNDAGHELIYQLVKPKLEELLK